MNLRPTRWRANWALAQITGVLVSSVVWIVLVAAAPEFVLGALLVSVGHVAWPRTRLVLRLLFGARPASADDRDAVLRAIVPVASLRGRNQPRVFVSRGWFARGWDVQAPCRRTLVVSEALVAEIRAGAISDLEVSALVAHAVGQMSVVGSRVVAAVDAYCLPWTVTEIAVDRFPSHLARIPLMSLSWRMRPVVFGLGLVDAVQSARWEAAVPVAGFAVLTYTTGPLNRAWRRKLAELGDRRVAAEGLGSVFSRLALDPSDPADRRRAETLMAVAK